MTEPPTGIAHDFGSTGQVVCASIYRFILPRPLHFPISIIHGSSIAFDILVGASHELQGQWIGSLLVWMRNHMPMRASDWK